MSALPTQAQIIQMQRKPEARFACSACGADRGCDCNAPAVEKLAHKAEQDRKNMRAYRERKKALDNAPVDNVEETTEPLNAVGKPFSPQYDPNYKIRTPLTSISRLYRRGRGCGLPAVLDDAPQARELRPHEIMGVVADVIRYQLHEHERRLYVMPDRACKRADELLDRMLRCAEDNGVSEKDLIDAFNRRFGIKQSALAA
jgi:hypothetical protein